MELFLETLRESTRLDIFALIALLIALCGQLVYAYAVLFHNTKPAISAVLLWIFFAVLTTWGQYKTGKVLPQTLIYLLTDPLILIAALFKGHWSPYGKEDWFAIALGMCGALIFIFFGENSGIGFMAVWVGINATLIPLIKNIRKDPYAESIVPWAILAAAGPFSLISSVTHFVSLWDLVSPIMYTGGSVLLIILIMRGRRPQFHTRIAKN